MLYFTKLRPELLLKSVGFTKAPDRGWQIELKPCLRHKPGKLLIPSERLHALIVGTEINVHLDVGKRNHRTFSQHSHVANIINIMKSHEGQVTRGN